MRSCTAILKACMYSQSPASTHLELPHWVLAAGRPRRICASSMMSSWTSVAVWMISTTEASFTAPRALVVKQLGREQQQGGTNALAPAARRYSPISVIAVTFETVSRPNSSSIGDQVIAQQVEDLFPVDGSGVLNLVLQAILTTETRSHGKIALCCLVFPSVTLCLRGEVF